MSELHGEIRVEAVMAREPPRHIRVHPICPVDEGRHKRASSLGTHGEPEHGYGAKDNLYSRTLSWLKNLKPWTKHSSPDVTRCDADSPCYNGTSYHGIRSSRLDKNLAQHLRHCSLDYNEETGARLSRYSLGRSSSFRSRYNQTRYSASFCPDRDSVDAYCGNTAYQPRYATSAASSCTGHSVVQNRVRPRTGSPLDNHRTSAATDNVGSSQVKFNHYDPLPQHQQMQQNTAAREQTCPADSGQLKQVCTCCQFHGLQGMTRSLTRNDFKIGDLQEDKTYCCSHQHPENQSTDQTKQTVSQAPTSGLTVTRILREKLFGRAKSSIILGLEQDDAQKQQHSSTSGSTSSTDLGGKSGSSLVKLRHNKYKPVSSDHKYVINREDKMCRPRSCATLPHDAKLGELPHAGFCTLHSAGACLWLCAHGCLSQHAAHVQARSCVFDVGSLAVC